MSKLFAIAKIGVYGAPKLHIINSETRKEALIKAHGATDMFADSLRQKSDNDLEELFTRCGFRIEEITSNMLNQKDLHVIKE